MLITLNVRFKGGQTFLMKYSKKFKINAIFLWKNKKRYIIPQGVKRGVGIIKLENEKEYTTNLVK